jgi:hypothetical protein
MLVNTVQVGKPITANTGGKNLVLHGVESLFKISFKCIYAELHNVQFCSIVKLTNSDRKLCVD